MKKNRKLINALISLVVFAAVVAGGWFFGGTLRGEYADVNANLQTDGTVVVNFLDVGQGDSEFIQLPDGKCMLIDAGISESADVISERISSLGYEKIDYLVATHPHADHIGGMREIVEGFDIGEIFMPKASTDTKTFENLLQAISDKGLGITTAKAGRVIVNEDDLKIEFLAPVGGGYGNLNNYSAVVKLSYGDNVFLFMGDAEKEAEQEILEKYPYYLDADVLKVGHHGSDTASGKNFINAVSPKLAVIEVGDGNSYGHPHSETLKTLNTVGAQVLRTDINGNISVVSDKTQLTLYCEKE